MVEFLADRKSAWAAWNIAMLQSHCYVSRLDWLHLNSFRTEKFSFKLKSTKDVYKRPNVFSTQSKS